MRLYPPSLLVYALTRPWLGSLKIHHFGLEHARAALHTSPKHHLMVCLWHHSLLGSLAAAMHSNLRLAGLTSLSGDGAIIAGLLKRMGFRAIRGSSSRGAGLAAKLVLQVLDEGWSPIIAIDGPRGPAKVVKSGALELARMSGAPCLPIAARSANELQFNSWDRFRLPLPGAHVAVCFGRPVLYPPQEPDAQELERRCLEMRGIIEALDEQATRMILRFGPKSRYRPRLADGRLVSPPAAPRS